jgi:serine/threonine protein kinase
MPYSITYFRNRDTDDLSFNEFIALNTLSASSNIQVSRNIRISDNIFARGLFGLVAATNRPHPTMAKIITIPAKLDVSELRKALASIWNEYTVFKKRFPAAKLPILRKNADGSRQCYFLMPKVGNVGLCDISKQTKKIKITFAECTKFAILLFLEIQKLHLLGYLHRDIKPENIRLSSTVDPQKKCLLIQKVYIIDFGLATDRQNPGTEVCGTRGFIPEEQRLGCANESSDGYAAALSIRELLGAFNLFSSLPPAMLTALACLTNEKYTDRIQNQKALDIFEDIRLEQQLEKIDAKIHKAFIQTNTIARITRYNYMQLIYEKSDFKRIPEAAVNIIKNSVNKLADDDILIKEFIDVLQVDTFINDTTIKKKQDLLTKIENIHTQFIQLKTDLTAQLNRIKNIKKLAPLPDDTWQLLTLYPELCRVLDEKHPKYNASIDSLVLFNKKMEKIQQKLALLTESNNEHHFTLLAGRKF